MPHYLTSHHAVDRLLERFPAVAAVAGRGLAAAQWLGLLANHAPVVAQQVGMDLMLSLELPMADGPTRIYLPVAPQGHGDTWVIRTVLTEEQGRANLAESSIRHEEAARAAWRTRKGFTKPYAQAFRPIHHPRKVAA